MIVFKSGSSFGDFFSRLLFYLLFNIVGLVLGTVFSVANRGEIIVSYIQLLLVSKPSVILYFLRISFFLILSYFAIRKNMTWVLRTLVFLNSFSFSFSAATFFLHFPSAGWLLQLLVLFPCWIEIIVFSWLWLRCLVFRSIDIPSDFWLSASYLLIAFSLDEFLINPFTAQLFIYS